MPTLLPRSPGPLATLFGDPRHGQIAVLAALVVYGIGWLDFEVTALQVLVTLTTAVGVQWIGVALIARRPTAHPAAGDAAHPATGPAGVDLRSPLISGLSLCLLLRTDHLALAVLGALLAIGSKFVLRSGGRHLFNPTNFAIVVLLAVTDRVWVSAGQWGTAALAAFLMFSAGSLVVHRSARSDITWAFLLAWAGLLFGRSLWLGEPLAIPLHRLQSGALILFAFHMISDPKTTPNARTGRMVFAMLVAVVGWWIQFRWFRTNGLLWALVAVSPLTPLLDRLFPAVPYRWDRPDVGRPAKESSPMVLSPPHPGPNTGPHLGPHRGLQTGPHARSVASRLVVALAALLAPLAFPDTATAFCGFYVAKADTKLFNQASKVVLVRDGDRTVMTLANDFSGDVREFAMVIPVPTFLEREQIHVGDRAVLDHLDAYTAPRLVEYFDEDPCSERPDIAYRIPAPMAAGAAREESAARAKSLGVTIEASYTVGEYDILILSARESDGLATWLRENDYRLPDGAETILASYLRQKVRFFVARVNLAAQAELGYSYLRPLQIAFESPKFMLPIRLGTINARGPQELFVFALTRNGRVETTNYRTVKLPSDSEIPSFVKDEFATFYRAMFDRATSREDMRVVFLEYAWDMAWCDPCAADPLSADELRQLGVFWIEPDRSGEQAGGARPLPVRPAPPVAQDAFVTRLHVRYDAEHFPEDLVFQTTGDRSNFQGRYVMRHAWKGPMSCRAADSYRDRVRERERLQAETLANLTGWELADIHRKMGARNDGDEPPAKPTEPWWKRIWGR